MQPGYPPYGQPQPQPAVDNNLTMSIVALILFWPLGLPAILASAKVKPALQHGDFHGAQRALADSKKWSKYALIATGVFYGLFALCCLGQAIIGAGLFSSSLVTS